MNKAEWRPTQKGSMFLAHGYYFPSWNSLFETWDEVARDWIQAVKDNDYEEFYNLRMALPYEDVEESPKASSLKNKIRLYNPGLVPNELAIKDGNGPILLLTCSVDVHKNKKNSDGRLDVEVLGHCANGSTYSVLWRRLRGDTEAYWFREFSAAYQADPEALKKNTWYMLETEILGQNYLSDDQKVYPIRLTGIDTAYEGYMVQTFCKRFPEGVIPILGVSKLSNAVNFIKEAKSDHGVYYQLMVVKYKDRLEKQMGLKWTGAPMPQPNGYLNYPTGGEYTQEYYDMYGGEQKLNLYDERTGRFKGTIWDRKYSKAPNHAWDCRVYNMALVDIFVHMVCTMAEIDGLDYKFVFDNLEASIG